MPGHHQKGVIVNPSEDEVFRRQNKAAKALIDKAQRGSVVDDISNALIRNLLPVADLQSGDDNGWTDTNERWVQSGLSGDSDNVVYNIDENNRAQDKVIRIYGVANVSDSPVTTAIKFQDGTGSVFYEVNVQSFDLVDLSDVILFDDDIEYRVSESGDIVQYADAGGGDDNVLYLGRVLESQGSTVTNRPPQTERSRGR